MNALITSEIFPDIEHMIYAIELRDNYTKGHSLRVADGSYVLASLYGLTIEENNKIYIAALLHDIGKIGIPDTILLKPGKLNEDEYNLVKQHGALSGKILEKMHKYSYLAPIAKHHHEDYNGLGYPDGLKGEEIPLGSRIISIIDVFDALTSKRIYRDVMPVKTALNIMNDMQDILKFDPKLYKLFIDNIELIINTKNYTEEKNDLEELDFLRNNFFFSDRLTKLLNRDALLTILKKTSFNNNIVLFSKLDIKEFRQYNELYGTNKGDILLQNMAVVLKEELKGIVNIKEPEQNDLFLFRLHSDIFCIVYIGHKIDYINYKVEQAILQITNKLGIETNYKILINSKKITKNIEKQMGHLL